MICNHRFLPRLSPLLILGLSVLINLAAGCSTQPLLGYSSERQQALANRVLETNQELPTLPMLDLSDGLAKLVDQRIDANWSTRLKVQELRKLLFDQDELNIEYNADITKTANETFESRSGNCLSMTSLFIAAARHVGVDAHFQTVVVKPTWDLQRNTLIRYEHIVATGRFDPGEAYVVDFLPDLSTTDSETKRISDVGAQALFYNNRGAENLVEGHYEDARLNLQMALRLNPDSSDAWSNIGAVNKRIGELELAEFSYRKAIAIDHRNLSALTNLARYYESQDQPEKAQGFMQRVKNYQARNPYYLSAVADLLYQSGQYDESVLLLKRAIQLKNDEPVFYQAMAKSCIALGQKDLAAKLQNKADALRTAAPQPPPPPPPGNAKHGFTTYTIKVR